MNSTIRLRAGPQSSQKGLVTLVLFEKIYFILIRHLLAPPSNLAPVQVSEFKGLKDVTFQAWQRFSKKVSNPDI